MNRNLPAIIGLLVLGAATGLFAAESKILSLYGDFEQETLAGWETSEKSVALVCRTTDADAREGKRCLEISGKNPGYCYPGVKINPYVVWNTSQPCVLKFSVKILARSPGYFLAAEIKGRGDDGKEYQWHYFAFHAGPFGDGQIKRGALQWGGGELAWTHPLKNSETTFNQWLPGLQYNQDYAQANKWVDFEIDLQKSFGVAGAPTRPARVTMTSLSLAGYLSPQKDWAGYRLDGIHLAGEGVSNATFE